MGLSIYVSFYCDWKGQHREHVLEVAAWVRRNYVRLPGSEPLSIVLPEESRRDELPGPVVPRMQKVAWSFSKTMWSLNPFLSKALLLDRLRVASAYLEDGCGIRYYEDSDEEEIDPTTLVAWRCKADVAFTALATPLWLLVLLFLTAISRIR
jgi:hypothetical protein